MEGISIGCLLQFKEVKMKFRNLLLTLVFALFLSAGAFVSSAEAQRHRTVRPVVIYRPIYSRPYWGYRRYYDPFYSSFYQSPYERYQEERYYAQNELAGNQRELAKHREKYSRDGVISAKERRELEDDVRDVQKARQRLANLNRYY
jgi:hypothetical protein